MSWSAYVAGLDGALLKAFGVATTYTPSGGAGVAVTGIFDAAYVRVEAGEAGVSSAGPAVFYRLAELPADPDLDDPTITIGAVAYRVVEVKKNGQGGVLLRLHKA